MALQRSHATETRQDLLRVLLIFAAFVVALGLIVAYGTMFGAQESAPIYQFMPDPAGIQLPF